MRSETEEILFCSPLWLSGESYAGSGNYYKYYETQLFELLKNFHKGLEKKISWYLEVSHNIEIYSG